MIDVPHVRNNTKYLLYLIATRNSLGFDVHHHVQKVEPLTIYVLQLENNKYYVGKTTQLDFRIQNHDNGIGSAWTKKYKPIKILKLFPNCDNYDEDKYTKMYIVSVHPG